MSKTIEDAVRSKYASVALSGLSSDQVGVQAVAEVFGYSPRGTEFHPRRGQPRRFLREPHRVRQPEAR